jgi:hypothetical protein
MCITSYFTSDAFNVMVDIGCVRIDTKHGHIILSITEAKKLIRILEEI